MLNLKIESPFIISGFNDMLIEIAERKNFYEYDVTNHTRINGLKRYIVDFYDENEDILFTGMIDIWQEDEKIHVEFTEL